MISLLSEQKEGRKGREEKIVNNKQKGKALQTKNLVNWLVNGCVLQEIPMNIAQTMDAFDGKNELCNIKACHIARKCVQANQVSHQIATGNKLHHEVQIVCILQRLPLSVLSKTSKVNVNESKIIHTCMYIRKKEKKEE